VAKRAADIVRVADAFEDHEATRIARDCLPAVRDRPLADREAPSVDVEPGNMIHHRLRHDISRRVRVQGESGADGLERRVRDHCRSREQAAVVQQPLYDQPSFRDEDAAPLDELRIRNVAVVRQARIQRIGDGDDRYVVRSSGALARSQPR
jgi:hypothetical protein